jgi:hypothetical protein
VKLPYDFKGKAGMLEILRLLQLPSGALTDILMPIAEARQL